MNKFGRALRKFVKHKKPEICMAAGTILGAAAIVTACIQTHNGLDNLVEDHKARLSKAKALPDDDPNKKKEVAFAYGKTVVATARLLAGPSVLFAGSVVSYYAAYHEMKIRNAGLAATAAAVRKQLKGYRGRVADKIGAEAEEDLYFGVHEEEIEETVIDENGEEKVVKTLSKSVVDDIEDSEYVKYLVKGNPRWDRAPEMVEYFLKCQQNYANDMLKTNGELTLNEVYDLLNFKRTDRGMVDGWIYDKHNPFGDNKVEFRVKRVKVPNEDGVGHSLGYAIDFNCDGNIYEEKRRRNGLKSFRKRKSDK